jgi:hypothetical protein
MIIGPNTRDRLCPLGFGAKQHGFTGGIPSGNPLPVLGDNDSPEIGRPQLLRFSSVYIHPIGVQRLPLSRPCKQQVSAVRKRTTCASGDDPFLSRNEMRRVMARSLSLYQRRHAGRFPRRVVVHKTTEFKEEEVSGCRDAFAGCENVDLYQIQQDTAWQGALIDPPTRHGETRGTAAAYPIMRGSAVQLGSRELLLWTQGNAPSATPGRSFFKEGKGIPHPILLKKFAGHGGWDEAVSAVLGLTKMNWNNDSLYDRLPVTLSYASTLAQTIKRMPQILPRPYEFRLFM